MDPGCCGDAAKVCLTLGLLLLANRHVGSNDTARGDLEHIKCDYMQLEAMVKGMEGPGSVLSSEKQGLEEEWKDPVGQQLVAQLVMTNDICIL